MLEILLATFAALLVVGTPIWVAMAGSAMLTIANDDAKPSVSVSDEKKGWRRNSSSGFMATQESASRDPRHAAVTWDLPWPRFPPFRVV